MKARRLWLNLHLYIGLSLGAVLILVGLTGSLLVFYHKIDQLLNPALLTVSAQDGYRPYSAAVAAAQAVHPGWHADSLLMPRASDGVLILWFKEAPGTVGQEDRWHQVAVDPYTAQVQGSRFIDTLTLRRDSVVATLYALHSTFLLGENGETLAGIVGLCLLLSSLSGIYLWWPRSGKFKQALTFKRDASRVRFHFDLHRTSGIYSVIILIVISFSGIYMIFPAYVTPLVNLFSTVSESAGNPVSSVRPGATAISIETAVTIADRLYPHAELKTIGLPENENGVYLITKRQAGEVGTSYGSTDIWIDQYSGAVLKVKDSRAMSAGDSFLAWQFPLHNGEAFGLAGRVIVCMTGFIPAIMAVTGTYIWLRKRRSRRSRLSNTAYTRAGVSPELR